MGQRFLDELAGFGVPMAMVCCLACRSHAYNFHLGLLRPERFWLGYRKVYSGRREADVVITSIRRGTAS
jgi:hypothetical protein